MVRKVKVALYGRDLRATVKNYPLNSDGTRVVIQSGGEGHFMPELDKESYIELPYRSPFSFWKISYSRLYVAQKWSNKCVNFITPEAVGPDPKLILDMAGTEMLKNLGKEKAETSLISYIMLALLLFITLNLLGVI